MISAKWRVKSQLGLTLVEAIIATAITAVLGILLPIIIINSTNLFYKQTSKVEQGLGINDALSKVRETIKESNGIAASYPISGPPTYTSASSQVVLKVPAIDGSGNTVSNTFDYFVFFLDQDKLRFKVFPDQIAPSARSAQDQILSLNVLSLKFHYFNSAIPPAEVAPTSATKVKITLSLKQKSGQDFETNIATSEANLRND